MKNEYLQISEDLKDCLDKTDKKNWRMLVKALKALDKRQTSIWMKDMLHELYAGYPLFRTEANHV